jgi:subtilisin family serine protease
LRHRIARIGAVLFLFAAIGMGTGARAAENSSGLTAKPLEALNTIDGPKSPTARFVRSDRSLLKAQGSKVIAVMVRLDYDPAGSYAGGIAGLSATSPSVTGLSIKENRAAVDTYERHLSAIDARVTGAIKNRIPKARVLRSFHLAYGGLSVLVPANRARDLLDIDGVVAIHEDTLNEPLTNVSTRFVKANEVWPDIGGEILAGSDVLVGVLDTGIWPEHPSYEDLGLPPFEGEVGCEFNPSGDPLLGDDFECQDKLVGAYAFTDTYLSVFDAEDGEFCNNATGECSARDSDGHGTHTSSTAAGDAKRLADIFDVSRGKVSGMAPGARLIMFRVCLLNGCFESDSTAAVDQAIADGVDVINFSISGGSDAYSDPVELAFLDFYAAGGLANASAGNSGPGAATANHAGPWTNTVGASTSNRHYFSTLVVTADNGDTFEAEGATITDGIDPTDIIKAEDVPGYGDALCLTPLPAGSVTGMVVACERGVIARVDKGFNVLQGGGAGLVLYNTTNLGLNTDNHWIPAIHIEGPEPADSFVAFLDSHTGEQASWTTGIRTKVRGDVMTSFSSRGPLGDFIKPDVTAPGIQILAGHSPDHIGTVGGPPGELFQAIAGTSMSSPHAAGVAALIKATHPEWTPGQIKSAMMTSARRDVLKEDGVTKTDPFDDGAGSIRGRWAVDVGLTFDVTADEYFASADDELGRIHLNLPSINVPSFLGSITTTRTAFNVTREDLTFQAKSNTPSGASIIVSPEVFTVGPGETQELTITIEGPDVAEGQHFGEIRLMSKTEGIRNLHLPVAFFKTVGQVQLSHTCEPESFPVGSHSDCDVTITNHAPVEANVSLDVTGPDSGISIENVSDPGVPTENGFTFDGTLTESQAPTIDAIAEGGSPYGYQSLAEICVPVPCNVVGVGDETLINFDVDPFLYGSESYNVVAMTSNGYAVAGEGTSEDLDYVPQVLPNSVRPNNVLGPFWTDLDPSAGGTLYAAIVTDGVDNWIILEWENVPTYSDHSQIHTFQLWLQTTGGVESNTFEYFLVMEPDGVGLTVGAENRLGTSGAMLGVAPVAGDAFHVETSPAPPGGAVSITYDAVGEAAGSYDIEARLESDVDNGVAIETVHLEVT